MPSEYDFLLPYSRGLRRTGRLMLVGAAFVAGVASTVLIVALPLRQVSNDKVTASSAETANPVNRGEKTATATDKNTAPPAQPQQKPAPQPRVAEANKPVDRTTGSTGTWTDTQAAADSNATSPDRPRETTALAAPTAKPTTASPPPAPSPHAVPNPATSPAAGAVTNDPSATANIEQPAASSGEAAIADSAAASGERPAARTSETPAARHKRKPSGTSVTSEQAAMISDASPVETREKPASRTSDSRRSKDKPSSGPFSASGSTMPAAETEQSQPREQASREKIAPTSEPASSRRSERAATRERHRARDERDFATRRQEPRGDTQERRFARTRDNQDSGREFVDDRGVRHIILPRRSSERYDSTMAFDEPVRSRRFFLFPFGLGRDDDD
jgi:hypothetical protein